MGRTGGGHERSRQLGSFWHVCASITCQLVRTCYALSRGLYAFQEPHLSVWLLGRRCAAVAPPSVAVAPPSIVSCGAAIN